MNEYVTKDSGVREEWASGMVRDSEESKARFDLLVAEKMDYRDQFLTQWRDSEANVYREVDPGRASEMHSAAVNRAEGAMIHWLSMDGDMADVFDIATQIEAAEYYGYYVDNLDYDESLGLPYGFQLLTRFAELMARGAKKYGDRNWEKGNGPDELRRAKSSAFRHLRQWVAGAADEDHAAAVLFNLMAAHYFAWHHGHQYAKTAMPKSYPIQHVGGGIPPTVPLREGEAMPQTTSEAREILARRYREASQRLATESQVF